MADIKRVTKEALEVQDGSPVETDIRKLENLELFFGTLRSKYLNKIAWLKVGQVLTDNILILINILCP